MADKPVTKKPKRSKKKWLIVLGALVGALGMASEQGLLPPLVGQLAVEALDELAPPPLE